MSKSTVGFSSARARKKAFPSGLSCLIEYRVEHYYDVFYGYGIWEGEPAFENLGDCTDDWSFYINENGLLVIAFADDTISPMGSVSFVISHTVTDAIASEDGLLLRRTAT